MFGLEDASARWLSRALRTEAVIGLHLHPDLQPAAAHNIMAAADAGVHVVSARHGMDARFLEYWQLLAEMGKARYVAVVDLGPVSLDVAEAAAIASRVLEEDVHPITLPLLDDDEAVIGVLDVVDGWQWFPDGREEAPRADFVEAVEAETDVLLDESGGDVFPAVFDGGLAVAATVDVPSGAGVRWLARHVPPRSVPVSTVVVPGDDPALPFVCAGSDGLQVGPALAVHALQTQEIAVVSLVDVLDPGLNDELLPGEVAAVRMEPVAAVGSLLVSR